MKAIEKYLETSFSEPLPFIQKNHTNYFLRSTWKYALCIPLRDESKNFDTLWNSLKSNHSERFIVIFVLNSRKSDHSSIKESNQNWLNKLRQKSQKSEMKDGHCFGSTQNYDFICINQSQDDQCFSEFEGVGHARKLGCDYILWLIYSKKVLAPWIWTTDGDAQIPQNYFDISDEFPPSSPAALYPFYHNRLEGSFLQRYAISLYEMSLHYYVQGLKWAKSDYSHMSVGSTISIQATAYASVRGFPEKLAGEDFYLLNKLRKLGHFHIIDKPSLTIALSSRASNRVPFGTGASIEKLIHQFENKKEFYLYSPKCFVELKTINESLKNLRTSDQINNLPKIEILKKIGIEAAFKKILKQAPAHQTQKQFRQCFDGFKSMRFIHELTVQDYPKVEWKKALDQFNQLAA